MPKHAKLESEVESDSARMGPRGKPRHASAVKHAKEQHSNRSAARIALLICIGAVLCFGDIYAWEQLKLHEASEQVKIDQASVEENLADAEAELLLAENPIDFEALQAENPDIYAWLHMPGTQVEYPVLQHPTDDDFYLEHTRQGFVSIEGAIYTELQNSKDFSDPVTVIYGHNIMGGLMFATLHDFADPQFFDENQEFFIYLPGRVLTYQIVAASVADDTHILHAHDFTNQDELDAYLRSIMDTSIWGGNVREGAALDTDSKIVQLSTCSNVNDNERFIVTGVLVEDRKSA